MVQLLKCERRSSDDNFGKLLTSYKPEEDVDRQSDPLHSDPGKGPIKVLLCYGGARFLQKGPSCVREGEDTCSSKVSTSQRARFIRMSRLTAWRPG